MVSWNEMGNRSVGVGMGTVARLRGGGFAGDKEKMMKKGERRKVYKKN
jgi:hypothetical protein